MQDDDTPGERFARAAMRGSRRLEGMDGWPLLRRMKEDEMPTRDESQQAASALLRMVDFRIPFALFLTGGTAVAITLAGMYFEQRNTARSMEKMEAQLSTVTELLAQMKAQQALTEFRLQKLEAAEARQGGVK